MSEGYRKDSKTPPRKSGSYWLKRSDGSSIVVFVSESLLCFSTHGNVGSKPERLKGLWTGPIINSDEGSVRLTDTLLRHKKLTKDTTMFGYPLEQLDRDSLLACLGWLLGAEARRRT